MADDIKADLSELAWLGPQLTALQAVVDGDLKTQIANATKQRLDTGGLPEAVEFVTKGYHAACQGMETNRGNLSKMLADLAAAAKTIQANYSDAAQTATISAQEVQTALKPVEADFTSKFS